MSTNSKLIKNKDSNILTSDAMLIFLFFLTLSIISIVISMILIPVKKDLYANIFYLPLLTGVFFIFSTFYVKTFRDNITNIMIYFLYFVRNSLAVYFLRAANYSSIMPIYNQSQIDKAILLMLIETLLVFIVIGRMGNEKKYKKINLSTEISSKFKSGILILFILSVFFYFIDPVIRDSYTSIFFGDITTLGTQGGIDSAYSIFYRLFRQLYPILQLFVPLLLISYSRSRFNQSGAGILISIIASFFPLFLVSSQSAYAVVVTVTLLLTIIKIYPRYQKVLFQAIGIMVFFIIALFVHQKIQGSNYSNSMFNISNFFQSYFPGVTNIAAAFLIPKNSVTIETFLNELITYLPLRQFIVTDWNLMNRSIHLFQDVIQNPYQIMSNVSVGYLYVGYLGPLLSVFMVWAANKFSNKKSNNIVMYSTNLFIAVFFAVGPIMLNIVNVGSRFVEIFIWLLLLSYFSDKSNINKMFNSK